jgi:hypothetical protein
MPKKVFDCTMSCNTMNFNHGFGDQLTIDSNIEGKEDWPDNINPSDMVPPLIIKSTKMVSNLNVEYFHGYTPDYFLKLKNNNLGIGIENPIERLEIDGGIKLSNSNSEIDGIIRWTGSDFEGRKSGIWTSLTETNVNTLLNHITQEEKISLSNATWHIVPHTLVKRDSNGNIAAGIIKSSLLGTVLDPKQPHITLLGNLESLNVGDINISKNTIRFGNTHQITIVNNDFKFIKSHTSQNADGEMIAKYKEIILDDCINLGNTISQNSGNIGIGISQPSEKLHINGGILIGTSESTINGTIRWTGVDFEGRKSDGWISLTQVSNLSNTNNLTIMSSDHNTIIKNTNTINFDKNTGFIITNSNIGEAKISMGSSWKDIIIAGQSSLSPIFKESLHLIAGEGILLKTNPHSEPKSITISSNVATIIPLIGITTEINTFLGKNAGINTIGANNVIIGVNSGYSNTTGFENVFIGKSAGYLNTDKILNTFIGCLAGYSNKTSQQCTYIGAGAGQYTDAQYNTFIGASAGQNISEGERNVYIGMKSGRGNSKNKGTGNQNTFVGGYNGFNMTTAFENALLGYASGYSLTEGNQNVLVGNKSGYKLEDGIKNIFIGANSGDNVKSGNKNIMIGNKSGHYLGESFNKLIIASGPNEDDVLIGGDFDKKILYFPGKIGISTNNPIYELDVLGDINFTGNLRSNGKDIITGLKEEILHLNEKINNILIKLDNL